MNVTENSNPTLYKSTETNSSHQNNFLCCLNMFQAVPFTNQTQESENVQQIVDEKSTDPDTQRLKDSLKTKLTLLLRNKKRRQRSDTKEETRSLRCESSETYSPHERASFAMIRSRSMSLLRRTSDFDDKYRGSSSVFPGMNSMLKKLGSEFIVSPDTPDIFSSVDPTTPRGGYNLKARSTLLATTSTSPTENKKLSVFMRGENRLTVLSKVCKDSLSQLTGGVSNNTTTKDLRLTPQKSVSIDEHQFTAPSKSLSGAVLSFDEGGGGMGASYGLQLGASSVDSYKSATERALLLDSTTSSIPTSPRARSLKYIEKLCDVTAAYTEVLQLQNNNDEAILHCIRALMAVDVFTASYSEEVQQSVATATSQRIVETGDDDTTTTGTSTTTVALPCSSPPPSSARPHSLHRHGRVAATTSSLAASHHTLSSGETTTMSFSGGSRDDVLGSSSNINTLTAALIKNSPLNGPVNAMLRAVWTRFSPSSIDGSDDKVSATADKHKAEEAEEDDFMEGFDSNDSADSDSPTSSREVKVDSDEGQTAVGYKDIDFDSWLHQCRHDPVVVRITAQTMHRLGSLLRSVKPKRMLHEARLCIQTSIQLLQVVACNSDTWSENNGDWSVEQASAYSLLCRILEEMGGSINEARMADKVARDFYTLSITNNNTQSSVLKNNA